MGGYCHFHSDVPPSSRTRWACRNTQIQPQRRNVGRGTSTHLGDVLDEVFGRLGHLLLRALWVRQYSRSGEDFRRRAEDGSQSCCERRGRAWARGPSRCLGRPTELRARSINRQHLRTEPRASSERTVVDEHDVERLGVVRLETLDDEEDAAPVCERQVSAAAASSHRGESNGPICVAREVVSLRARRANIVKRRAHVADTEVGHVKDHCPTEPKTVSPTVRLRGGRPHALLILSTGGAKRHRILSIWNRTKSSSALGDWSNVRCLATWM